MFHRRHKRPNTAIRILLITNGVILFAGFMLGPIYALFVEEVGGDLFDASLAAGAFAFAAGITTLISGKVADIIKRPDYVVVAGYLVMALGFLLFTQVHGIMGLFLIQAMIGMGEAIYSPAYDAIYSEHMTRGRYGLEWGEWETMNYFIMAISAVIGGWVVTTFSFNTLFVTMAIISAVSSFYILLLPRKIL